MKLVRKLSVLLMAGVCAVGFTASAFAGNGGGGPMRGADGNGNGPVQGEGIHGSGPEKMPPPPVSILEGEPVTVNGIVSSVEVMRRGIDIETAEGIVTVYGFGPVSFWEDAGLTYPAEGDTLTVNGYEVTFSDGTVRIIAANATTADGEFQLVDTETGLPLWPPKGQIGTPPKPPVLILEGEPVTVDGMVAEIGTGRDGIQIDTGDEVITVFGFGPVWYWEQLEVVYPSVGDPVSIEGYEVTLDDGTTRIIAAAVSLGDADVTLHDPETGLPLWLQERGLRHRPDAEETEEESE